MRVLSFINESSERTEEPDKRHEHKTPGLLPIPSVLSGRHFRLQSSAAACRQAASFDFAREFANRVPSADRVDRRASLMPGTMLISLERRIPEKAPE